MAIPKKLHDKLGLAPGDYLEVELRGNRLILTPKQLVDERLEEAEQDIKKGRVHGPFKTAKETSRALRTPPR